MTRAVSSPAFISSFVWSNKFLTPIAAQGARHLHSRLNASHPSIVSPTLGLCYLFLKTLIAFLFVVHLDEEIVWAQKLPVGTNEVGSGVFLPAFRYCGTFSA